MSGGPDFEFVPGAARPMSSPADEDELSGPPPRLRRWPPRGWRPRRSTIWFAYAAIGIIVAATLVIRWPSAQHAPQAVPTTPTPNAAAAADDVSLIAELKFVANTPGPLADDSRGDTSAGQCPSLPIGQSPLDGVVLALHRDIPQFHVVDSALTLDRTTAPCDIDVRARDARGDIAVIIVNAPPNPQQADQQETERDGDIDYLAVSMTSTPIDVVATCIPGMQCGGSHLPLVPPGWKVEVGTMSISQNASPDANQDPVTTDDLLTLAYDPELIW